MRNRRDFLKTVAGATVGAAVAVPGFLHAGAKTALPQAAAGTRRQVTVAGRPAKVVDIHAHCMFPEVGELVKDTPLARFGGQAGGSQALGPKRLAALDALGIDVQALSVNVFWWYSAERDLAEKIVQLHDEKLAAWVSAHPDRFVGLSSVALQFPDLAAKQLEHAVKNLGIRGAAIGGSINGEPLSGPRFDPFWAKAEELGVIVFMHPDGATNLVTKDGLKGSGDPGNVIGNPFETTVFLSHLIFDGTLDRFPGLKICSAHAGGFLPSYVGRADQACDVRPNANCMNKKHPSDYFRQQLMVDSMIFNDEGLRHLAAQLGPSQIVYGTDMPFNWPDSVDLILNDKFLSDGDKTAILGGTLTKLLKL